MSLNDFLAWVVNSGGAIVILSWLAERIAWFQKQTPDVKQYLFFGGSFVISALAYAVLHYVPADILAQLAPWFGLLYASFVTVFAAKGFHLLDKLSNK